MNLFPICIAYTQTKLKGILSFDKRSALALEGLDSGCTWSVSLSLRARSLSLSWCLEVQSLLTSLVPAQQSHGTRHRRNTSFSFNIRLLNREKNVVYIIAIP